MRTQIFPGNSLQYFIKWKHRRRSNTLNSRNHGHSTQVINIHEKIGGHGFPLGFACDENHKRRLDLAMIKITWISQHFNAASYFENKKMDISSIIAHGYDSDNMS